MMAQLYQAFTKWVEENRHFPAKVSMRSGHPILHAAEWLGEREKLKSSEWDEMWINRSVMSSHNYDTESLAPNYIRQENIDKPFTLVDNGYDGSISEAISSHYNNHTLQTLLMLGGIKFPNDPKNAAFISYLNALLKYSKSEMVPKVKNGAIGCLQTLVEIMPHEFAPYGAHSFEMNESGIIVPIPKKLTRLQDDAFHSYRMGMRDGFEDCFSAVQSQDSEQFDKYVRLLIEATPTAMQVMKATAPIDGRPSNPAGRLSEQREKLAEHFSHIQEVYEKG